MPFEKIVLITRRTRLMELIARYNSRPQAKFAIDRAGGNFADYEGEDEAYRKALDTLRGGLSRLLKVQVVDREFVPSFLFAEKDLVVTAGQDGLVANTAKYVNGQPILAVNPDPERFDGLLLPFTVGEASPAVQRLLAGKGRLRAVTLAEARLNDAQRLLAFNDLFIGARSHVSARYLIRFRDRWEQHSSSGVIVSTGAGSTGWMSSVFHMAAGVMTFAGQPVPAVKVQMDWEDERLLFAVREPFLSRTSQVGLVAGMIAPGEVLVIESRMPGGGVIFSDGMEADFLQFNSGASARIRIAGKKAHLVVK
jgi:hypothetical protein